MNSVAVKEAQDQDQRYQRGGAKPRLAGCEDAATTLATSTSELSKVVTEEACLTTDIP